MAEDAPVSLSAGGRRICSVCCQAVAAYTCPRCHKAYCTSACYKQHGQQCTEAFYREQATSQMKAMRADAAQTQQMMRILQRMHVQGSQEQQQQQHGDGSSAGSSDAGSEDGSETEDDGEAAAAAAGLDRWLAQSPEFQQLLQRAVAQGDAFEVLPSDLSAELADRLGALALSGRLSHLLAPWKPWWANPAAADISLNASGQRVVAELHTDSSSAVATTAAQASTNGSSKNAQQSAASTSNALRLDSEGFASLPDPPEQPLQSLVQLAGPRFRPSPLLPYELLQLLVAYCAVMHYWNGEPDCGGNSGSWSSSDRGWEAAEQLMLLAPPLEQQATRIASSRKMQQAQQLSTMEQDKDTASSPQQQQQQSVLAVADSVRCACMQLADAAAALHSELRALLQQATADALALLQLGRAAVLLALTDSCRLLDQGRRNLKQQQQQRHRSHLQANVAGKHSDGTSSMYSLQQSSQQQVQLEQQLKLACRKLVFFQVWCNEQGPAVFEQLSQLLAVELRERQAITTPPAAAGVKLGVQPVELSRQQQHQQQQQQQRRAAHVVQEAVEAPPCEDAKGPALRAANGQQQQQQQQRHGFQEQASTQATGSCIQCGGKQHQQQEQQQQQVRSHISAGGGSAPISDLYELD